MAMTPATKSAVSIMLADSNPLVLSGMSEAFERDARFSLVATAATAEGFLASMVRVPAQVGIIDWNLPIIGGARLLEVLREQEVSPRIVVYAHASDEVHVQALAAGAAGFVARNCPVEMLLDTCMSVAEGRMVFPYLDVRQLQRDPMHTLSRREAAMLEALSKGLTNRELSKELEISTNTVKFHLSNLYDKLAVRNRAQAIAYYYSNKHGKIAGNDGDQGVDGPSRNKR